MSGFFLTLIAFVYSEPAIADEIRPAYLSIEEKDAAPSEAQSDARFLYHITWKTPLRANQPLAVTPVFTTQCQAEPGSTPEHQTNAIINSFDLICTQPLRGNTVSFQGLDATLTDVLVRYRPLAGKPQILRATASKPYINITVIPSSWEVARTYFILGTEHIWFGYDHLFFVLGLVLLITGFRRILETVTAFTLAHSLTLIATTLGWIRLPIAPVEAVIALSIVFLAIEIASKKPGEKRFTETYPWLIALTFGLLHGFGFASALANIGLPEQDVPTALLTFNLGVEFGQITFVLVLILFLNLIRKIQLNRPAELIASYSIGSISVFWLIQRVVL